MLNLMDLNGEYAIKKALDEFGLKKKTKSFWNKLITECVLSSSLIEKIGLMNLDMSFEDILCTQFDLIRDNNIEISDSYIKGFSEMYFKEKSFNKLIKLIMTRPISNDIKSILVRNSYLIDEESRLYLFDKLGVNQSFKLGLLNDKLFKDNIDDFDFSLIAKYGLKGLDMSTVMNVFPDDKFAVMNDDPDSRPNIGWQNMIGYENGGFKIDETHSNGYSLYIPYGISTDILNAIQRIDMILVRERDESSEFIKQYSSNEDYASKYLVSMHKERVESIEKDQMIINSLAECISDM